MDPGDRPRWPTVAGAASPGNGGSDGGTDGGGRGKRPSSASPVASESPSKRGKAEEEASEPKESAPAEAAGKSSGPAEANVKEQPQPPWARMLSQNSRIPHVPICGDEISVGRGDNCHMCLDDQAVSADLCLLRRLEEGGSCELEVTGKIDHVRVNETNFRYGDKVILRGGDEVVFDLMGKHAYIFQHPVKNKVLISADSSTDTGRNILVFKEKVKQGVLSPDDINVTLANFPYYVSGPTKEMLLSSAFIHMEKEFRKCLQEISSLNQRILLLGPLGSEMYQEALIKALAKHFDARLLILDSFMLCGESLKDVRRGDAPTSNSGADVVRTSDQKTFREGDRVEYFGSGLLISMERAPAYGSRGTVVLAFEKNQFSKVGVRFDNPITCGNDLGGLCEGNHGFFCCAAKLRYDTSCGEEVDSLASGNLIEEISEESKSSKLIVLLKDVERSFTVCKGLHASLRSELPPGVLIIGSQTQAESNEDQSHPVSWPPSGNGTLLYYSQEAFRSKPEKNRSGTESTKNLNDIFPNKVSIELPQNEAQLSDLKKQLKHDTEILKAEANVLNIDKFLTTRGIGCNDLQELCIKDQLLTNENVDKIVGSAISHHIQKNNPPKDAKIVLPIESLKHGLGVVQSIHSGNNVLKEVVAQNIYEQKILSNVISPNDTGVTFEDIGALDNVKETLTELVMLPLQRPELFSKGQLRKSVKGILLFGPPGTGKTMLAKAVATVAGARFINISMSSITSMWFGETEKYVKAIFSLASKISPSVIFVDEVDSLLGKRESPEGSREMCKIKNEFMVNWDGLLTKELERVTVIGATNRPFDLDDAVIRRFPRRLMVSLPEASSREKILKAILSKELLALDVDLKLVANLTDGYSGSDLKNLCVTAALCRIREIMEKEKKEKSLAKAEGRLEPLLSGSEAVRPLRMDDFKFALGQVSASNSPDSRTMDQLVEWNNKFGDGGSRQKETPTYIF